MENLLLVRIRELMNENSIPASRLTTDCGLNRNFIYDLEKKNVQPSAPALSKIADYFDVSTDYLLGKTVIKKQPTPEKQAKADLLMQLLIEKGVISEDYTPEDLARVADVFKANAPFIKEILNKDKQ